MIPLARLALFVSLVFVSLPVFGALHTVATLCRAVTVFFTRTQLLMADALLALWHWLGGVR